MHKQRKRFSKQIRKGHTDAGYSLLELVVTIAVLAVVGTGISTLMVTGTRLYASQSASVRLQSRAQLLTSQLRSYYLSAEGDLSFEQDTFRYSAGGKMQAIVYDRPSGHLYLAENVEEETEQASTRKLPLLAEGVQDFSVTLPLSAEHMTPVEIVTAITLEDHGATYEVEFVTALRNHGTDVPAKDEEDV